MPSVLLIDPQEDFASGLADALRKKGIAITTVVDGKEGLLLAQQSRPDAIVLCIEQREMSGLTICSSLRRRDPTRAIPLVLTSVDATNFTTHRTSKSKADAYLEKPFSAIDLLGVLNKLIDTNARDTVSDLQVPARLKSIQQAAMPATSPTNGHPESTADLLASDLPQPREDSGGDLDWMVKLRQSIARRDTQIAELRAKVEEASRAQAAIHEKERRFQEEVQKIGRERDETIKVNMSMQEKLTSTRLDLDDTKKRYAKEKKTLEERAAALQKQMDEKLAVQKKQSDEVIATLKHQLDDVTQRDQDKATALDGLQRQAKTLSQKLDETTRNLEATKKNASDLRTQNEKQANRIAQLEEELKRALADADSKRQSIVRLEDQLAKSQADHAKEVFALTEDLKAAQAGSEAKSKTIVMRDDELARQKANYEKRLAAMDDQLRGVNSTLEAKGKQHLKDLGARDASISGLKQKLAALADEMELENQQHQRAIESANDAHAKELTRVREEMQNRIAQTESQQREAIKRIELEKLQAESERQAMEAQAIDLSKRFASVEKQLAGVRQTLADQERKNEELAEKVAAAEHRAQEAERMQAAGREARRELHETLEGMSRAVDAARSALSKLGQD